MLRTHIAISTVLGAKHVWRAWPPCINASMATMLFMAAAHRLKYLLVLFYNCMHTSTCPQAIPQGAASDSTAGGSTAGPGTTPGGTGGGAQAHEGSTPAGIGAALHRAWESGMWGLDVLEARPRATLWLLGVLPVTAASVWMLTWDGRTPAPQGGLKLRLTPARLDTMLDQAMAPVVIAWGVVLAFSGLLHIIHHLLHLDRCLAHFLGALFKGSRSDVGGGRSSSESSGNGSGGSPSKGSAAARSSAATGSSSSSSAVSAGLQLVGSAVQAVWAVVCAMAVVATFIVGLQPSFSIAPAAGQRLLT